MGLFGRKKKNPFDIFGGGNGNGPPSYNTPGYGDGTMQGQLPPMDAQQPQKQSWFDGGKFTGKDALALALGTIGDAFTQQSGGQPVFGQMMIQKFEGNRKRQEDQRRLADTTAVYEKIGIDPQTAALAARAGVNPKDLMPDKPAIIRDAEAWAGMTPEQRKNYQALKDAQAGPVTITLPNGQLYSGPRDGMAAAMGGRQQGGLPSAPVGPLTMLPDGPATIQNTPAPQTGANGFPAELTPDQYQATVNALGKAQTDEWMRRNNIRIGGR